MKKKYIFICSFLFLQQIYGQYTQVPDPNFEQALIDLGIDSEGVLDGQFLTVGAQGVVNLPISNKSISDLTGLEAFVDLHDLLANNNNLTSIDLSVLPPTMWTIRLNNNNFSSLDLTPLTNVVNLFLGGDNLTTLTVPDLPNLFSLAVNDLPFITSLNIGNCPNLYALEFTSTTLETIDLSNLPNLGLVRCQESQIQTLDFTQNQNLNEVYAYNTPLTSINLPNNPNLEYMQIFNNQLIELDVANCPALWYLHCSNNLLTGLDLSGNPNLEFLQASNNELTTIDLSQNSNLTDISINNNSLSEINLSNNIELVYLSCSNNPLEEITGIDNCINLETISCEQSLLTSIDLSQNQNLEIANFFQNSYLLIANIKNGNNENLIFVGTQCPQLSCVVVDDPSAPNIDILVDPHTILVGAVEECDLGFANSYLEELVTLFPNPVKDFLNFDNIDQEEIDEINIYNITGKLVYKEISNFNHLNLSDLVSGVYFINIQTEQGSFTSKIIKD